MRSVFLFLYRTDYTEIIFSPLDGVVMARWLLPPGKNSILHMTYLISAGKRIMIRGWYHSRENGRRLLSIDEIAGACCTSNQEVKKWIVDKIQKLGKTESDLIDAP